MTDAQNRSGGSDFAHQPYGFTSPPGPPGGYGRRLGSRAGRSRNWPWALAILLVAAVAAIPTIIGVVHTDSSLGALARVAMPGGGLVTLPHAGGNVIYYESDSSEIPAINLTITPVSAGAGWADLTAPSSSSTYSVGSRNTVEVFTVQVTHPGQFRISVTGPDGPVAGTDLAIGPDVGDSLFLGVLATILLGLCGMGVILVLILRKSARTRGKSQMPV